ncbi:methyltransferase [Paracidovorax avenae]|uniref:methyltransferase n=1 Tax=Paracidovorax avenae TaxID=80867 RepID=UPI000D17D53F|nr:class I SAM-dependent methyltransferase [Paracidovorax avenae]AVS69911.1 methyltransferase [Paracidovorax avenae]
MIHWNHGGQDRSAQWHSEAGVAAPRRVVVADDTLPADAAYRMACEGTGLLWQGDFQNARHLLQALMRRADGRGRPRGGAKGRGKAVAAPATAPTQAFHLHRQAQAQRARVLGMLLIPVEGDHGIALRRAPDWRPALAEAWGAPDGTPRVASLRELLGLVGAHEWRKKGVEIPALGAPPDNRIHPHYGVFSPVRGEYIDLVAQVPLPAGAAALAFDIGTGTGVLAAVLARRGVRRVVATDQDPRALACARENLQRLRVLPAVDILQADLFPPGRAPLVVCNPPWVPARAAAPVERAVYDEDSRMLRGFLGGLAGHLEPGGEGWLILSDLAEHLELRPRAQLLGWIEAAGLQVLGRHDVRPRHGKAADASDPLHAARAAEVTSLWRLGAA